MGMSDDIRARHLRTGDFLGVFAVVERPAGILMVQNERVIGGRPVATWDLPGGQVEPGELLGEALARELREETGLSVHGEPRFLFVQEGERVQAGRRAWAWRSFFFAVAAAGEPRAAGEVLAARWFARAELLPQGELDRVVLVDAVLCLAALLGEGAKLCQDQAEHLEPDPIRGMVISPGLRCSSSRRAARKPVRRDSMTSNAPVPEKPGLFRDESSSVRATVRSKRVWRIAVKRDWISACSDDGAISHDVAGENGVSWSDN